MLNLVFFFIIFSIFVLFIYSFFKKKKFYLIEVVSLVFKKLSQTERDVFAATTNLNLDF